MASLTGVKLTTREVRAISEDLRQISSDVDDIMGDFNNIMTTFTGQAEGGLIQQTETAAEQLINGVLNLSRCFLNIGLQIGDYLMALITQDEELASDLRNRIEN